jgi:16S rRNA processing protein RimM
MVALTILKSSKSESFPTPGGPEDRSITVATGLKLRGATGRLTATLVPGGVDQFRGRTWVLVGRTTGPGGRQEVEEYEIYGQKVILKLRGVDSASQAQALVGQDILIPCNGLVDLPEGTYYIFELVGMRVTTRDGKVLGTVTSVVRTGGTPLLSIAGKSGAPDDEKPREILIPVARSICTTIDKAAMSIVVEPPEGLLELYGI